MEKVVGKKKETPWLSVQNLPLALVTALEHLRYRGQLYLALLAKAQT